MTGGVVSGGRPRWYTVMGQKHTLDCPAPSVAWNVKMAVPRSWVNVNVVALTARGVSIDSKLTDKSVELTPTLSLNRGRVKFTTTTAEASTG